MILHLLYLRINSKHELLLYARLLRREWNEEARKTRSLLLRKMHTTKYNNPRKASAISYCREVQKYHTLRISNYAKEGC